MLFSFFLFTRIFKATFPCVPLVMIFGLSVSVFLLSVLILTRVPSRLRCTIFSSMKSKHWNLKWNNNRTSQYYRRLSLLYFEQIYVCKKNLIVDCIFDCWKNKTNRFHVGSVSSTPGNWIYHFSNNAYFNFFTLNK